MKEIEREINILIFCNNSMNLTNLLLNTEYDFIHTSKYTKVHKETSVLWPTQNFLLYKSNLFI